MADYIEREAYVKYLASRESSFIDDYGKGWSAGIYTARIDAEEFPAADVAPVIRGSWNLLRHDRFSDVFQCSECGRKVSLTHGRDVLEQFPYCHCGAKMEDAPCPEHQP